MRVRSSQAPVLTLPAWAQTMVGAAPPAFEGPVQGVDVDGAVGVRGQLHHRRPAQAEQPERGVDAGVALLAGQHPDGRRPGQAALLDVPAGLLEDPVPAGRQPHGVGRRGAGDEAKRARVGDAEQVF